MCTSNLNYWISTLFQTVNFSVSIHQILLESPVSSSAYQELKSRMAGIQILLLCQTQKHTCIMENYFKRSIKPPNSQYPTYSDLSRVMKWQFNSFHLVPCSPPNREVQQSQWFQAQAQLFLHFSLHCHSRAFCSMYKVYLPEFLTL